MPAATSPELAVHALRQLCSTGGHEFWPDGVQYVVDETLLGNLRGHKQVTDAHLLTVARRQKGCVVTFDRAFAQLGGDDVHLLTR